MRLLRRTSAAGLLALIVIFELSAFCLLAFRTSTVDIGALTTGGIMVALLLAQYLVLTALFKHLDRYLLIIANILIAIGMIVQYRINPDIASRQLVWIAIGMGLMILAMVLVRNIDFWKKPVWLYMIGSIGLLAATLAMGRSIGGAKNWISIGGFPFQPSEFVKIALVFALACWLSVKQTFMKLIPLFIFLLMAVGLLLLSRDLGAALLYVSTAIIVYFVATGNVLMTGLGLVGASGGAVMSYFLFSHVRVRVAVWRNPWASYQTQGYQIAQGLMAIASGGLLGMGLTRGVPKVIPAYHTDYIFAVICEEFGIIVGLCMIAFYLLFMLRGISIAMKSSDRFSTLVACGCTAILTLQAMLIIGGVIKMIPLTGVTLPFVSYGGSSMISSLLILGILEALAIRNGRQLDEALQKTGGAA